MKIFIIGFKSSGKTTTGAKLAERLGYQFFDLDNQIEIMTSRTVPEIFSEDGEEVFRMKEKEALLELSDRENVIISTGGGAPCWHKNMDFMISKGITIYLNHTNETLVKRLGKATVDRPIVKGKTIEELWDYVLTQKKEREHFYLKANYIIEAGNLNPNDLVNEILKELKFS